MKSSEGSGKDRGHRKRRVVTWEAVERAQLETMLTATPAERLAWLEEAMRLARASGALEAAREEPDSRG